MPGIKPPTGTNAEKLFMTSSQNYKSYFGGNLDVPKIKKLNKVYFIYV